MSQKQLVVSLFGIVLAQEDQDLIVLLTLLDSLNLIEQYSLRMNWSMMRALGQGLLNSKMKVSLFIYLLLFFSRGRDACFPL